MKPPQVSCENHVALDSFIAWLVLQNLLFFLCRACEPVCVKFDEISSLLSIPGVTLRNLMLYCKDRKLFISS